MIEKIKEIVSSWAISVNPTAEQKQIAEIRLRTCMACEFWAKNAMGITYCKECGCSTSAKVFTPRGMQGCPKGKWKI